MRNPFVFASFALWSLSVVACGSSKPSVESTPTAEASTTEAEPSAGLTSAASASPSASASAAPESTGRKQKVPFGGETPSGGVKVSGSAWVYWPDDNGVSRYNVKESTDTKTTLFAFGSQDETFSVPTAFVRPVSPPNGLAKGDIVWTTVVQGLECALVREAKEEKAKVDLYWAGKRETRDVALGELLHPTGKAEFGAPVLFKKGDAWVGGVLVHADKKTAWIAPGASFGTDEVKVDVASIRPMDVNKRRKKGDKVIACPSDCVAGKILAAKDQGLTYEVQDGDDGPVMDVSACAISSIPK